MQNFVFISPNYPESYWMFVRGLKKHGARVLCVIDCPYESLHPELKKNMDECYRVSSFHNYEEVFKAVAYFSYKYGKVDWIESNNEAWLGLDARLRDDFNVKTGFSKAKIDEYQSKAAMKKYYRNAGIAVAPYCLPNTLEECLQFAEVYGYSLVLKPDHGVGASYTWHIHNEDELRKYFEESRALNAQMILEKFISGDIIALDGVCDQNGTIRFLGSLEYVGNCMDSVQNYDSIGCYYEFHISDEYRDIAQRVADSFELRNRFFHGEYFRLTEDLDAIGKKGDLIGLEVNFRPPGGFAPDLINYTYDIDIYDLWAEILMTQKETPWNISRHSAGFAGRRTGIDYKYPLEELTSKYSGELIGVEYLPPAFAATMGDVTIKARFEDRDRRLEFFRDTFERRSDSQ